MARGARDPGSPRPPRGAPVPIEVHESGREPSPRRRGRIPGGLAARGRFDEGVRRIVREQTKPVRGRDAVLLIDHRSARLLVRDDGRLVEVRRFAGFDEPRSKATGFRGSPRPAHVGGNPESKRANARVEHLARYYDEILDQLGDVERLLVAGEGEARLEFRRRLRRRPLIEARLAGSRAVSERIGDAALLAHLDEAVSDRSAKSKVPPRRSED